MVKENSFTWGNATIGVQRDLTVDDDERIYDLMGRLDERDGSARKRYTFAEFMIAAQIDGEPPLPLVDEQSADEDIAASWQAWGKLPRGFLRQWRVLSSEDSADPK